MKIKRNLFALLSFFVVCAVQAQTDAPATDRFPPGSISTLEAAELALQAIEVDRARLHARYEEEERNCQEQFFVNRCIDQARKRRREGMQPLDALEVEAKRFQRQQRAEKRDREMAERRLQAEEKAAEAAKMTPPAPRLPPAPVEPQGKPREREPKPAPTPEQEAAAAREREENEAAYIRKVEAAKARQEAVARRKAEKEAERTGP